MDTRTALHDEDVVVTTAGGRVGAADIARARHVLARAAAHAAEPVLAARVRLVHHRDPALRQPYTVRASLDVNGRMIRAHAVADTVGQAIDALDDRLRGQVQRLARYRDQHAADRRGEPAGPLPGGRHQVADDQPRKIVRHRADPLPATDIDEAAWDMDLMDDEFRLFVDADSGQDTVIYRAGPTGYRVAQVHPRPHWQPRAAVPVTYSRRPAAHLTLPDAIDHLEATAQPFQFYAVASGRGRIVYRRHDGDYGVIVPPD